MDEKAALKTAERLSEILERKSGFRVTISPSRANVECRTTTFTLKHTRPDIGSFLMGKGFKAVDNPHKKGFGAWAHPQEQGAYVNPTTGNKLELIVDFPEREAARHARRIEEELSARFMMRRMR